MEHVRTALECAAVDDDILGVLIKGPTGTAKSVIARSFVNILPDKEMISVPQNVTDEQLFGGLDLEDAITHGRTTVRGGTLRRADMNILYLDNINLFDPRTVNSVLEHAESGRVIVEREGVSSEYSLRTTVIATMDPAEQMLPDSIADRFDICVQSHSVKEWTERSDLIYSNIQFDIYPDVSVDEYSEEDGKVLERIENAKRILGDVSISRADLEKISSVCADLNVKGHRADISMARVSRVLAALDGRTSVSDADIKGSAVMCLLHRRRNLTKEAIVAEPDEEYDPEVKETSKPVPEPLEKKINEDNGPNTEPVAEEGNTISDIIASVTESLNDMDDIEAVRLHQIAGAGRRKNIIVRKRTGRYRGIRIPDGETNDLAFDATVRAAAPYQRTRENKGLSISIEKSDIKEKIRMKRDSCSFLFAVDVSGSLVDSGMMNDIKNGVKAMLLESYVKRDKVALMTFRTMDIKISVPFTRSVEGICDALDRTEGGGGTPLGAALLLIRDYLLSYLRKNPEERCYVIMMTDGETTDPVLKGEPIWELKKIAPFMKMRNTEWVIIDSSLFVGRINHAKRLAALLNGRYIRLEDIRSV
ncbi:MAG: VWA domain-containing protein [Methanomassiliicoccaceae archaeon]|nr:VWA domain-containing protein [Methanomassiliicoccaceae archaeon]